MSLMFLKDGMGPLLTLELIAPTEVLTQNPELLGQNIVCHMISVGVNGEHQIKLCL